jgi:hypothetical protein
VAQINPYPDDEPAAGAQCFGQLPICVYYLGNRIRGGGEPQESILKIDSDQGGSRRMNGKLRHKKNRNGETIFEIEGLLELYR